MSNLIRVAWGPKSSTVGECAICVARTLDSLASLHPLLAHWWPTGTKYSEEVCSTAIPQLEGLVRRGVNRRDSDQSVIEDLGFSVSLWNRHKSSDKMVTIRFQCSATFRPSSGAANLIVIKLPNEISDKQILLAILRELDSIWEPRFGVVCASEAIHRRETVDPSPLVGWMTLLPCQVTRWLAGTPGVTVIPLDKSSNVIVVVDEENQDVGAHDAISNAMRNLAETNLLEIVR